jgi:hypothetical protein
MQRPLHIAKIVEEIFAKKEKQADPSLLFEKQKARP